MSYVWLIYYSFVCVFVVLRVDHKKPKHPDDRNALTDELVLGWMPQGDYGVEETYSPRALLQCVGSLQNRQLFLAFLWNHQIIGLRPSALVGWTGPEVPFPELIKEALSYAQMRERQTAKTSILQFLGDSAQTIVCEDVVQIMVDYLVDPWVLGLVLHTPYWPDDHYNYAKEQESDSVMRAKLIELLS